MFEIDTESVLMGIDWRLCIHADYERPEPSTGLAGGFSIERVLLTGVHDGTDWVTFITPAELNLATLTERERERLEKLLELEFMGLQRTMDEHDAGGFYDA